MKQCLNQYTLNVLMSLQFTHIDATYLETSCNMKVYIISCLGTRKLKQIEIRKSSLYPYSNNKTFPFNFVLSDQPGPVISSVAPYLVRVRGNLTTLPLPIGGTVVYNPLRNQTDQPHFLNSLIVQLNLFYHGMARSCVTVIAFLSILPLIYIYCFLDIY